MVPKSLEALCPNAQTVGTESESEAEGKTRDFVMLINRDPERGIFFEKKKVEEKLCIKIQWCYIPTKGLEK